MKIVFMPMLPLTHRDYENLGIKYFHEKGYDVSVLESHQLLLAGYKNSVTLEYMKFEKHFEPTTVEELFTIIKPLSENDYIFFYLASKEALSLLNQMKKITQAKFATYISGSVPPHNYKCDLYDTMKFSLRFFIRHYINKLGLRTFTSDLYFTGAPRDQLIFPFLSGIDTKKLHVHSRDYELCMHTTGYSHAKPYCVFLDTDVIDASDYILFGDESNKNIEAYQNKLVTFFNWIQLNMKVVIIISAHPKSRIFLKQETFYGFKVIHNQSASLVKNSEFVLSEGTTAVSFPVYFNKPMIFFTMEEIKFFYKHTCKYATLFEKPIFNIDDLDILNNADIYKDLANMKKYEYFKYNYLTYDDDDISVFEMIEKELKFGR